MNNKELVNDVRSSSLLSYDFEEGFGTLHKQWMSPLSSHYSISQAERVPEILHFEYNLKVDIGRNGTIWSARAL